MRLRRKMTDADRIKILQKETEKYRRINVSLDKEREKAERESQKAELEIRKLNRQTKLAHAKAAASKARASQSQAEGEVWQQRYKKAQKIISPISRIITGKKKRRSKPRRRR